MERFPSGTVTFIFTDIEGSTRLIEELGEEGYVEALAEHRRLLRRAFSGGVEVDTQGDAFFVAFPRASDALAAANEAQRALDSGLIKVRMGLHTGEPLVTDEGYVGIDVHRAARIAAAGHGGQVLVSQTTRDLLDAAELRDLGEHRLKDLSEPQRLYQLGPADFPQQPQAALIVAEQDEIAAEVVGVADVRPDDLALLAPRRSGRTVRGGEAVRVELLAAVETLTGIADENRHHVSRILA